MCVHVCVCMHAGHFHYSRRSSVVDAARNENKNKIKINSSLNKNCIMTGASAWVGSVAFPKSLFFNFSAGMTLEN